MINNHAFLERRQHEQSLLDMIDFYFIFQVASAIASLDLPYTAGYKCNQI